jgi:hypothetical protein
MPESGSGPGQPGKPAAFARQPGINDLILVVNRAGKRYEERNQKNDDGSMGTILQMMWLPYGPDVLRSDFQYISFYGMNPGSLTGSASLLPLSRDGLYYRSFQDKGVERKRFMVRA